jgi:hypothetical protein
MHDPQLKERLAGLVREGIESPYLDRLQARVNPVQSLEDVQREIYSEMAQALGRSEENLERELLELDVIAHRLRALGPDADGDARASLEAGFDAHRERALTRRWELEVHREALGFNDHTALDKLHPIPPAKRR